METKKPEYDDGRAAPGGTAPAVRRVGLIPAAGRGTRLAPLPFSKELMPVGFQHAREGADRKPKPVSQYLLERMRRAGTQQVFFITRPGKGDIADYYGDGRRLGMDFAYLQAGLPWGPPFSLAQAVPFIGDAEVVFGFPDILIDPVDSFTPLLARQVATGADVVLGLFNATAREPGDVITWDRDSGQVLNLETKEERPQRPAHYICWMFAVWNGRFSAFLKAECERLAGVARQRLAAAPQAPAPEWPVGAVISAAIRAGLQVNSVYFPQGRFLDIGEPDGITAAAAFPGVWDGRSPYPDEAGSAT
ncbi:MAG: sugar phosphate nucleotidyltransferase [Lautropia sp.]|nr:sugar phosphate nucleotidyltransferase [Lautropia sp.]